MCKRAREKIGAIPDLGVPERRGFDIVLEEIGKLKKGQNALEDRMTRLEDAANLHTKQNTEMLTLVNDINKKLTDGNLEKKAAQMEILEEALKKKYVRYALVAIFAAFILSGVAIAYFVERSHNVAEIAQSVHK